MQPPKLKNHPEVIKSIETGYLVMEQLKEKGEPLDDNLLYRYLSFGSDRLKVLLDKLDEGGLTDREEDELNELRKTFPDALEAIGLLERCAYPVPRDIMKRVCRCSRSSLFNYNKDLLNKIEQLCHAEIEKADCTDLL